MSARRCIARRLSPKRRASTIAPRSGAPHERAQRLVDAIKAVLNDAIKAGGSSLRDHRRTDGALGDFQHDFRVYDREGETLSDPRLRRHHPAHRADRALDLLLPAVSALTAPDTGQGRSLAPAGQLMTFDGYRQIERRPARPFGVQRGNDAEPAG